MTLIDHLNEYMTDRTALGAEFGKVIRRLLNRCDLAARLAVEDRGPEMLDLAQEFYALSSLLSIVGSACVARNKPEIEVEDASGGGPTSPGAN